MPFSLLAARCLYVAKQSPKYRMDVIKRIFNARVAAHTTLFTFACVPMVAENVLDIPPPNFRPDTFHVNDQVGS